MKFKNSQEILKKFYFVKNYIYATMFIEIFYDILISIKFKFIYKFF